MIRSALNNPGTTTASRNGDCTPPARILVVDDQLTNIQLVGQVLGKLGYEIIPASDGATALRRLAPHPPDLILLDLLMPEMDGCEVCRRLRDNPDWKDIPVIFLSAADEKDIVVRALEAGGVDYLTKPFSQAELVSRVRTQLDLKFTRDRLRRLAEDKDELMGILTHDLKNHLGGMEMSAQLLRDRLDRAQPVDERAALLAENIANTSGRLLAFVKEFLANSAAEHGLQIKPSAILLADVVAAAVHQHGEAARRKQLELHISLPAGVTVWADAAALGQVLDNLLSNAVKFSPPGKGIFIHVEPCATHVECRVQDQGPGFTDADKPRMFRRYARLSARPTGNEPSTGLGLSIVHKLVQEMDGELVCESNPGKGATFIVRLRPPVVRLEAHSAVSP